MLFSAKGKGFFVEQNDHATLLARTSAPSGEVVVEAVAECPPGDGAALTEAIRGLQQKKSTSGYVHATCGIYSQKRLVRRVSLDLKRVREAGYLNEVVSSQFRVEPEQYMLAVLNAADGTEYDPNKSQKEVIICGLPSDEIITKQDALLAASVYPVRLELGTTAVLGGLVDCLAFAKLKTPTLVLEL